LVSAYFYLPGDFWLDSVFDYLFPVDRVTHA
jgi:hypothetical protein